MILCKALSRCLLEGREEFQGNFSLTAAGLRQEDGNLDFPKTITKGGNSSASFGTKAKLTVGVFWDVTCSGRVAILLECDVF